MESVPLLVVGGVSAGLSVGHELTAQAVGHELTAQAVGHELTAQAVGDVVLERGRIGQAWRDRWDSFCLVTPIWSVRLGDDAAIVARAIAAAAGR